MSHSHILPGNDRFPEMPWATFLTGAIITVVLLTVAVVVSAEHGSSWMEPAVLIGIAATQFYRAWMAYKQL
jgi:hypothetical protein